MRKTLLVVLTTFALVLGFVGVAGAASPTKAYKVTIKTSTTASEAGKFITVSGKVSGPKSAGKTVKIQRQYAGGAWVTVATAKASKKGKYSARVETPRGGTTSFRAVKAKSSVRKAGVSPTAALPVYEWLYLASQGASIQGDVLEGNEMLINGTLFKRSIAFYDGDAQLTYKLAGLCTKFTSRVGYRFSGDLGTPDGLNAVVTRLQLSGPAVAPTSTPVATGQAVTLNSTLTNTRFLQLELDSVETDYVAALGDPKVYCNASYLPSFGVGDF